MSKFLLICLGGALGTGARYLMCDWALARFGDSFPYGTLTVNIIGSFLMGIVMHLGLTTELFSPTTRFVLVTGVLGGFTTYSAFNYETLNYFQNGEPLKGMTNLFVMVGACFMSGLLGLALAKKLAGG